MGFGYPPSYGLEEFNILLSSLAVEIPLRKHPWKN